MKIFKIALAAAIGILTEIAPASAGIVTEQFKFQSASYLIQGQFKYDDSTLFVQDITGTVTASGPAAGYGGAINGIVAIPIDAAIAPFFVVDNKFNPSTGTFSFNGILFSFGSGNYGNLFFYDPTLFNDPPFPNASTAFSSFLPDAPTSGGNYGPLYSPGELGTLELKAVGAIPEPSTWAMLIFGFIGIAMAARRGRGLKSRVG